MTGTGVTREEWKDNRWSNAPSGCVQHPEGPPGKHWLHARARTCARTHTHTSQDAQTNTLVLKSRIHTPVCTQSECKAIICSTLPQCWTKQPSLLWVHLSHSAALHLLLFSPYLHFPATQHKKHEHLRAAVRHWALEAVPGRQRCSEEKVRTLHHGV